MLVLGAHSSSAQEIVFVIGKKSQECLQLLCACLELGDTEQPDLGFVGSLVTPLCLSETGLSAFCIWNSVEQQFYAFRH